MIQVLGLGLVAAILWGAHDICVRYVSQRSGILPSILMVLTFGFLFQLPITYLFADWAQLDVLAFLYALASGAFFAIGTVSLYRGFAIGPVRLVAPIVGSYPVLSIAHAIWAGQQITPIQFLAVILIISGIAIVAYGNENDSNGKRSHAVLWGLSGALSFALSFAIGQSAAADGAATSTIALARLAAIVLLISIMLILRQNKIPKRREWPLLAFMGFLDGSALALVLYAGSRAHAEFASVTASIFGLFTIIFAWAILKEPMTRHQWCGVAVVFSAIACLGVL